MVLRLTDNRLKTLASEKDNTPASAEQAPASQPPADSAAPLMETTPSSNDVAVQTEKPPLQKPVLRKETEMEKELRDEAADNGAASYDTQTFSNPHAAAGPRARSAGQALMKDDAAAVFKIRVADTSGNPIPYATVVNLQNHKAAPADGDGKLLVQADDTLIKISVNAVGYQSQTVTLAASRNENTIALRPGEAALSEVVVTGRGKKKATPANVRLEAVEPLSGWSRFNTYVDQNLTPPEDPNARGEVGLSFDVDRSGNAVNIVVDKPLCTSCDSTAVRLIRNGGKWKKSRKNGNAKAYIRY